MAAHFDGLDKALCGIHLFLDIQQRLLGLATQVVLVLLILLHRINKRLRHLEFGHLAVVQRKSDGAIILGIHNKVGGYLLHAATHGFAKRCTWTWIQFAQFAEQGLGLHVVQLQVGLYLVPMFAGKCLKVMVDNTLHQIAQP